MMLIPSRGYSNCTRMTLYTFRYTFTACVYGYLSDSVVFVTFLDSHEYLRNMILLPKIGFTQVSYGIFFSDGLVDDTLPNNDDL